jgi:hypothetical protein
MVRNSVLALVLTLSTLAATAAAAQDFDGRYDDRGGVSFEDRDWGRPRWDREPRLLPPRVIEGSLYRRGFDDVDIKRVRGRSYIAEAIGRRGRRVMLVVDGRTTEITGMRVIDWGRPGRGLWGSFDDGGWAGPSPCSGPRW